MDRGLRLSVAGILLMGAPAFGGDLVLHSGPEQVHLLELFTSEGCSSCPPAEARLSALERDPGLWKDVVPVSFHVDYWDHLGWPDRFASPEYTDRQRNYARTWGSDSVYTPEFVLDGREFRGGEIPGPAAGGGNLTVKLSSSRILTIRYAPPCSEPADSWQAHIATLGLGLETNVGAGENGGRHLRHDFVALALLAVSPKPGADLAVLTLPMPKEGEKALAVWITRADQSAPVQAVGGWTGGG